MRVKTAAGAEYAEYTYAPSDRILNGFIQADVGLYDYTSITHDPLGLQLFEAGDAEARAEVPHYDTGAWSMYDQYGESDLNYHELLTEFLQHLCERTRKGPPTSTVVTPAPSPTPPAPGGGGAGTTGPGSETGGASAAVARSPEHLLASAAGTTATTPIAGDAIYCTTAQHFTSRPAHAAGRLPDHEHPAHELARGRAGVAVEDLHRQNLDQARRQDRVEQRRERRTGQAEDPLEHPLADRRLPGHDHRDRPRRQLLHGQRHDHPRQALRTALRRAPSATA